MLDYMNQCNGHGDPNTSTGKCECYSGYHGADCSVKPTSLSSNPSTSHTITGQRWTYYKVPAGESFTLSVTSDLGVDLYVKTGGDEIPDTVNFDSVTKN